MVQMALQEIICNGVKTDNVQTVASHNSVPKYEEICGKDTDGINDKEKSDVEDASVAFSHEDEQNLDIFVNTKCEIVNTNHLCCVSDESTDTFSSSFLTSAEAVAEENGRELNEDLSLTKGKPSIVEKHDCLLHPTHLSLVNKFEASKNTISNLEETVERLEKLLSLETSKKEKISQLERTIEQHEKEIQLCKQEHEIDQRTICSLKKEMETKLLAIKKQYETANKEKENMVMRYAVSEKELLDCKKEKENIEKKMKDVVKDSESSLTKLKTITSEKIKVSQQLDSKISEVSNAYKEIDKLKEEINARDIKIKWTQNKLKSEMDSHKECPIIIERLNSNIQTLEGEMENCKKQISHLNLQLEKNKYVENILNELETSLSLENLELPEFISTNKTLQSEFQALLMENNLLSHQIEDVEQIWLALDGSPSKEDSVVSNDDNKTQSNTTTKNDGLKSLLKETEHILSEVSNLRNANEKMLSNISACQAKSAELLCLSPLRITSINKQSQPHTLGTEQKIEIGKNLLSENKISTTQLKNRIVDLERQLAEEKVSKENNIKSLARTEEILNEVDKLRCTNEELMSDIASCKAREAELLAFTQKLTTKNVKLQSEFSAVESKANELEKNEKNHAAAEFQFKNDIEQLQRNLCDEKERRIEETRLLARQVAEKTAKVDSLMESVNTLHSELSLVKNKHSVQLKELQRELSQYRRKVEQLESAATGSAGSTGNSLTSGSKSTTSSLSSLNDSPVIQGIDVPAQVLVERIVKLQQESAKQNDRIEFLEEHSAQLVKELQKKSRLLQNYIMREQAGTLTSNSMDRSKAELSKSGGIMASLYGSKPADETMTFELCLEINRKLQAVLEDTLLKNITLKENIDTLGDEIARLTQEKS